MLKIYHELPLKLCRKDAEKSSQNPLNFPCDDLDWSPSRPSPSHGPVMVSAAPTLGWCYHPDRCHSSPHWARGWHWSHSPIENWRIYEKIKVKPNDWATSMAICTTGKQVQETMGGHETCWRSWTILEETENVPLELKNDFQMMLMIKRATFGMCCFPLCIVSAPTTRSMHPVCMYVYTLSIYICIYILLWLLWHIYIYTCIY